MIRHFLCFSVATAIAATGASVVRAQTPAGGAGSATIEGVAIDSLHQDFLRGATLTVEGAESRAVTDSLGRFKLENVPPGTRRVEVLHPLLDSVGVSLRTPPIQLVAGQHMRLVVSTPSVATVLAVKCSAAERSVGEAALLGTVEYAETDRPAAGSRVLLEWIEHRVTGKSIQQIPRERSAVVSEEGRFKFCSLPQDVSGTITAMSGADSTSAVDVHLAGPLGVIGLELPEPSASAAAEKPRVARATLTGIVLDPGGTPLARARVSVDADTAFAVTGSDGRFTVHNLRTGTRLISVRRLGFEPTQLPVDLRATRPTDVTVRMGELVAQLDTVRISAVRRNQQLDKVGFNRRMTMASGFFMTPDQIEKRNAYDVADLLTGAPMLRRTSGSRGTIISGRTPQVNVGGTGSTSFSNGCVIFVVDGVPWRGGDVNDFVAANDVAAIEVYAKTFVPAQFRSGFDDCETVVIWTKQKIR
jgi:hypothetical protein